MARKSRQPRDDDQEFIDSEDDTAAEEGRPKPSKRRKTSRSDKRTRGTRSRKRLTALFDFPLDVVYEIFSHLHPAHLLNISRTNKALRGTLMQKSARGVWRLSFEGVEDLPPVPDDLNEPQYARLLFDKSCMVLLPGTQHVYCRLGARLRCCKRCLESQFLSEGQIPNIAALSRYNRHFTDVLPTFKVTDRRGDEFSIKCGDPERSVEFIENTMRCAFRKEEVTREALEEWDAMRQEMRSAELIDICRNRKEAIYAKLRDLGWDEEIKKSIFELEYHPLISKRQPLTERGWKKIQHDVVGYITTLRDERLRLERLAKNKMRYKGFSDAYDDYLASQPPEAVFPTVGNLVTLDHVRIAIEETPIDVEITEETYRKLVHEIPKSFYTEWREKADAQLLAKMTKALGGPINKSDLYLASTFFKNHMTPSINPRHTRPYPDILADPLVGVGDPYGAEVHLRTGYWPWLATWISFGPALQATARDFIVRADADPDTATHKDMLLKDPWFIHKKPAREKSILMRWPNVVNHVTMSASDLFERWPEERAAVTRRDLTTLSWQPYIADELVLCTHCPAHFRRSDKLYEHLTDVHDKVRITCKDFAFRCGGTMYPQRITMPSHGVVTKGMLRIE
ncbi:hypothetical protein BD626DRAFT_511706 [Schizophyllum amplum]|uniref:F-box domain-containing protein n=1 Tax=Schizophyllum amplum TaxID=97359 RepID=A0A550C0R3_9AGAR|nr:hypothetical protein BD626DRAFT_511706 [Auriculariopsis ampla]